MNKAFLLIGISVALLGACSGDQQNETSDAARAISPWHSLTEAEVREAATAVMDSTDDAIVFNRVSLLEPDKKQAITWQGTEPARRGADVLYRSNQQSWRAQYDFQNQQLSSTTVITSGQPMLAAEEIFPVIETVNALPEVVAALEKRGVSEGSGLCLPRTVGRFFSELADPVNARLVRFDCLNIRGQSGLKILPTTSAFARPVEGLSILVDVENARVIELSD